jgi:hypothetical protein
MLRYWLIALTAVFLLGSACADGDQALSEECVGASRCKTQGLLRVRIFERECADRAGNEQCERKEVRGRGNLRLGLADLTRPKAEACTADGCGATADALLAGMNLQPGRWQIVAPDDRRLGHAAPVEVEMSAGEITDARVVYAGKLPD